VTSSLDILFDEHHAALPGADEFSAVASETDPRRIAEALGGDLDIYRLFAGGSVDLRAVCRIREALGYVSPLADSIYAVHGLGTFPIVVAGTDEQKTALDEHRAGRRIGAFALTEPEAGSDVASMRCKATQRGDEWVLDGEKTFISNVGIADSFVVFANAAPDQGRDGITAFLVDKDTPGLVLEPFEVGYDHPIGALHFADCVLPGTALLGGAGQGFALAMQTLDTFRVSVGAAAIGMAARAMDEALAHVRQRVQFGKPLSAQPVVRSQLAEMATDLEASRWLVYGAAHRRDGGADITTQAAMAKLFATEAAQRIIDRAVQLFGGRGVKVGEVVEGLYRAIRPLRIYEGTSEIQRLIIGRSLVRGETT